VKRLLLVLPCYLVLALGVTALWTRGAKTEWCSDSLDVVGPSGQYYSSRFNSIVRIAEGTALSPFVKRRLLVDLSRCLVAVLPSSTWVALHEWLGSPGAVPTWLHQQLDFLSWKVEYYPLLLTATGLIWLSVAGFMASCRWLVQFWYETPAWMADLLGAVLGIALLGGNGDWHYSAYPYDFPNAFVFTLTLAALLARRWWFVLPFVAAVYSKETSILLIIAYVLVARDRRSLSFWTVGAGLCAVYILLRGWIEVTYPSPEGGFWFPMRNTKYLLMQVFYLWYLPFLGVALARFLALREKYPVLLKRLSLLAVPLLGLALFKGWIEEMRQYLEMLPIFGLMLLQWTLHEAGFRDLLRPRPEHLPSAHSTVVAEKLPSRKEPSVTANAA
jgi:hypothetical protein